MINIYQYKSKQVGFLLVLILVRIYLGAEKHASGLTATHSW